MYQSSRIQVEKSRLNGKRQPDLETSCRERVEVDRLEFTDVLQVERGTKILGNVDVQTISVWIEQTRNRAHARRQKILSSPNPCAVSGAMNQFFGSDSYAMGSHQNDAD